MVMTFTELRILGGERIRDGQQVLLGQVWDKDFPVGMSDRLLGSESGAQGGEN